MQTWHAFRSRAKGDDRRRAGQRGADALVEACSAALRAGEAPPRHGIRPHVLVALSEETLAEDDGVVEANLTGPHSLAEARPLLSDATVAGIVRDPRRIPIAVTSDVRTVPSGLYKTLLLRDGGCTWDGCDIPAGWCQVAHGNTPYRLGGKLTLRNAALLCQHHHRQFDRSNLRMVVEAETVTYEPPDLSAASPPIRGARVNWPPGGDDPPSKDHPPGGQAIGTL